jgi:hypothetical protein
MHTIADTKALVAEGVIPAHAARLIEARARETMVRLAVNGLLIFGILAATGGLILWLADAASVATVGGLALGLGVGVIWQGSALCRMFGHAAALIGAGMLIGGAALELADKYPEAAGWIGLLLGGAIALGCGWARRHGPDRTHVVAGAVLLMGVALHLWGLGHVLEDAALAGAPMVLFWLYAAAAIAAAGWFIDVRLVTALAIVPFAQALDTGTFYFHAAYVFYSPEATLSILQMGLLVGLGLWLAARLPERTGRHALTLVMLGFVVANLCALVGSLWGDVVGETIWGPRRWSYAYTGHETYWAARDAFRETAFVIPAPAYAIGWAVALAALIGWAAHRNRRGLFNAAMTFAAIHAYTQLFESFGNEPLAWVIGGLVAIPLAWAMWRLNGWFLARRAAPGAG